MAGEYEACRSAPSLTVAGITAPKSPADERMVKCSVMGGYQPHFVHLLHRGERAVSRFPGDELGATPRRLAIRLAGADGSNPLPSFVVGRTCDGRPVDAQMREGSARAVSELAVRC